jgi:hypothetical protein
MRPLTWILLLILAVVGVVWFMTSRNAPPAPAAPVVNNKGPKPSTISQVKEWLTVPGALKEPVQSLKDLFK